MTLKGANLAIALMIGFGLLAGAFTGGVAVGWLLQERTSASAQSLPEILRTQLAPELGDDSPSPAGLEDLSAPFWEAWKIVHEKYVDQPINDEELMRGAIRGMVDALGDAHSSYLDPDEYRQLTTSLQGEYDGIGVEVDTSTEYLTVVTAFPGYPAEAAGIRSGDQIIAVDGEDMTGIDGSLVIRRVLGPAGTKVLLTIQREGLAEPFDVEITRAKITLPNQEYRMLEGNIGYVRLYNFGDNTTADLRRALRDLLRQEPVGLILDLRYNGGGYLHTAVEVSSQFIGAGVIVIERYGDGREEKTEAQRGGLATDIPLVVLVNEGSASASEIVAGAIQDHGRGQLVGVTTFGKGSVQATETLKNQQGMVRITIARWFTPNGRQIHEVGLEPDVIVEMTDADFEANRDPQLDKAVELLTK